MKKSHLLGLAAAGILLAGCYHTGVTQQGAPVESEVPVTEGITETEVVSENTVRYTDDGFLPSSINVEAGTAVTFVNESSGGMWVASAVHPTHRVLPGFDQLTAVGNGGSYSYIFAEAGDWKFHNHVSPGDTGTVVVE